MIDIHSHILPSLDDGSKDEASSLLMGQIAMNEGIKEIIATPHYIEYTAEAAVKSNIEVKVAQLNNLFSENEININVNIGSEVYVSPTVFQRIEKGQIATLNNSRYILLELPMNSIPLYTFDVFYELQLMGLVPILAHPERYSEIIKSPEILLPFLEKGVLLQVNSGSITGNFGEKVCRTVWKLIEGNMVSFVGTDAHTARSRAPFMKAAYECISGKMGEDTAERIFRENGKKVIENQDIKYVEYSLNRKEKIGWSKMFYAIKSIMAG